MIRSQKDLAVVRRQLGLAEDSLVDLHCELGSKEHRNYRLYGDAIIGMIRKLRDEIDEFLGIAAAPEKLVTANGTHAAEQARESAAT